MKLKQMSNILNMLAKDDRKENVGLGDTEYYRIHCDGCNLETGSECNKEDLIYRWNHIDR